MGGGGVEGAQIAPHGETPALEDSKLLYRKKIRNHMD